MSFAKDAGFGDSTLLSLWRK